MSEEVEIYSVTHQRVVFCSKTDYYKRHSGTHLNAYYTELTSTGQVVDRKVKLPMDSEGEGWSVCRESDI